MLPTLFDAGGVPRRLAAGAGKDGNIYVVDRSNVGKFHSTNIIWQEVTGALGGQEFGTSAYFNNTVYFGAAGGNLTAFAFSNALLGSSASSHSSAAFTYPGATPSVSSNGNSNAIVWATENTSPAVLHGYDATNLASELYNSNMAAASRDHFGNGNKFIAPMIANGKVYVGTTTGVGVFGILAGAVAPVITSPNSAAAAVGVPFRYQITATNGPTAFSQSNLPAGLSFNTASGIIAGTPSSQGISVVSLSAMNTGGTGTLNLTITVAQGLPVPAPVAVYRDPSGAIHSVTDNAALPINSGGVFQSNPASSQSPAGDTFVVATDPEGGVWVNVLGGASQTWRGWSGAGGLTQGNPSIAVSPVTGISYFSARDNFNAYWLNSYSTSTGFGSWTFLGGVFATDPVMAAAPDGSVYLVGRDNSSAIWSGHYIPGTGFQNWKSGGAVVQGKPSVTAGSDNAAYIAIRDNSNAVWMGRVLGNTWTGWFPGGGVVNSDPVVATMPGGVNFTAIVDASGGVWYRPFEEGPVSGWQTWTSVGGVLQGVSACATSNGLVIAGFGSSSVWWYRRLDATWISASQAGVPTFLDASPK